MNRNPRVTAIQPKRVLLARVVAGEEPSNVAENVVVESYPADEQDDDFVQLPPSWCGME